MATKLYSVDVGDNISNITSTTGSSTTAGLECTIDLAKFTSKRQAVLALTNLINYILQTGDLQ